MSHLSIRLAWALPLAACMPALPAQGAPGDPLNAPVRVSDSAGTAREPFLSIDASNEPVIVFASSSGVSVTRGLLAFREPVHFASSLVYRCPRLSRGPLGSLHILFQENDPTQPERGGEIYGTSNLGGQWRVPGNLTWNLVDDAGLVSTNASDGQPRFAWTREGKTIVIYEGGSATPIGDGVACGMAAHGTEIHVAILRGGDIIHGRREGLLLQERNLTQTPDAEESSPRIAIAPDGSPAVVYVREGALFLRFGTLDEEIPVSGDFAEASEPWIAFAPDGRLALAFAAAGRIRMTIGDPAALPPAQPIDDEESAESAPSVDFDARGVMHIAFVSDGEILYANDAPPPEPAFDVEPGLGERPLRVQFLNRTQGDVRRWLWEFGDGATSAERSPEHIYEAEGAFEVTLHAFGPAGREVTATVEDAVLIQSASNVMRIPNMSAFPGERQMIIPVLATHPDPIQGLQIAFVYDPSVIVLEETTFQGTVFQNMLPEFFIPRIDAQEGLFIAGLVLDVSTGLGRVVWPGVNQHVLNFKARIAGNAPQGTETRIELRNQLGDEPKKNNIFSVDGHSVLPVLESSTVRILHVPFPPPMLFVRGDVDADGQMLLTDA
ncbi:MAG: PKD domain-containing protein, partial [Planctomycetes bacterium]|nr:PKD domain-containing protein [Planctomycetota bacterium]